MAPNVRWQFVLVYTAPTLAQPVRWTTSPPPCVDGAVRVGEEAGLPLHHFSLEQAAEAHAAVESGAIGKVLIDVSP